MNHETKYGIGSIAESYSIFAVKSIQIFFVQNVQNSAPSFYTLSGDQLKADNLLDRDRFIAD